VFGGVTCSRGRQVVRAYFRCQLRDLEGCAAPARTRRFAAAGCSATRAIPGDSYVQGALRRARRQGGALPRARLRQRLTPGRARLSRAAPTTRLKILLGRRPSGKTGSAVSLRYGQPRDCVDCGRTLILSPLRPGLDAVAARVGVPGLFAGAGAAPPVCRGAIPAAATRRECSGRLGGRSAPNGHVATEVVLLLFSTRCRTLNAWASMPPRSGRQRDHRLTGSSRGGRGPRTGMLPPALTEGMHRRTVDGRHTPPAGKGASGARFECREVP
jgi:hypothetical protein